MNWFSENKFLAGFGAAMLVGLGTLGYLTYSAMGKYDTAVGEFDTAASQLRSLQETKPALTDANLNELNAQKKELGDKIAAFQKELKARVLPVEPITKEGFQDLLKETVKRVTEKAQDAKVERQKDFYGGFPEYQAKPPEGRAAPALARQLRALELVMNVLNEAGNLEINEFQRGPLPEESGKPKVANVQPGSGKQKGSRGKSPSEVIERAGLRIKFTSTDSTQQKVIAGLANHKDQLFVIRKIAVQNQVLESPPRLLGDAAAPVVPPAPSTPDPSVAPAPGAPQDPPADAVAPAPPASTGYTYVFGKEKIVTTIDLELLNIVDP